MVSELSIPPADCKPERSIAYAANSPTMADMARVPNSQQAILDIEKIKARAL